LLIQLEVEMKPSAAFLLILMFLLPACAPFAAPEPTPDVKLEAATRVAVALTQTAMAAPPTPEPPVTLTPSPPSAATQGATGQEIYQDAALGLLFQYPASWFVQTPDSPNPQVALTSFDPLKPPHKLEWTGQTVSMQFRLLSAENTAPSLDAWVEKAKKTAAAGFLTISGEETLQIAAQPARHLTLVSGSGGVIHQVLTILDGSNYEILIEGNFDLARAVLDTVALLPAAGLKPADSDTPAAGICGAAQGDITRIELGAGPDGLPLAGRCMFFTRRQRIQLVNATGGRLTMDFARYSIDLEAGGEMLLDKPVGEFLALGVHFLPHGPEIWVK
jgi:hypothetical protein